MRKRDWVMHDGSKQRWLFERDPGIVLLRSKTPRGCVGQMTFGPTSSAALLQCCCRCCLYWHLFLTLACANRPMTPAVLEAIEQKAAEPVKALRPDGRKGVKPFCGFGYFYQENSTEMVAIAYHDLPVGLGWILYAPFSVVSILVPASFCCLSPPKTLAGALYTPTVPHSACTSLVVAEKRSSVLSQRERKGLTCVLTAAFGSSGTKKPNWHHVRRRKEQGGKGVVGTKGRDDRRESCPPTVQDTLVPRAVPTRARVSEEEKEKQKKEQEGQEDQEGQEEAGATQKKNKKTTVHPLDCQVLKERIWAAGRPWILPKRQTKSNNKTSHSLDKCVVTVAPNALRREAGDPVGAGSQLAEFNVWIWQSCQPSCRRQCGCSMADALAAEAPSASRRLRASGPETRSLHLSLSPSLSVFCFSCRLLRPGHRRRLVVPLRGGLSLRSGIWLLISHI